MFIIQTLIRLLCVDCLLNCSTQFCEKMNELLPNRCLSLLTLYDKPQSRTRLS